jgi:hypothetical protein
MPPIIEAVRVYATLGEMAGFARRASTRSPGLLVPIGNSRHEATRRSPGLSPPPYGRERVG